MGYQSFFQSDGWLSLVQGHVPDQLEEARRTHNKREDKHDTLLRHGAVLHGLAEQYLSKLQTHIQENVNYGLMGFLGGTTYVELASVSLHTTRFSPPSP